MHFSAQFTHLSAQVSDIFFAGPILASTFQTADAFLYGGYEYLTIPSEKSEWLRL